MTPGDVQVRCAGCGLILSVAPNVTEFVCPTCKLPHLLPPELPKPKTPAHGIDPTKIQLPCANFKALLNVPHGLTRFSCPQCHVDLAVDISKLMHFLPPPIPVVVDEVNEVAIEVEREEDEGGTVGETFMDYRHLQRLPNGARAGFFIGDGAGVGKGRTIAGLIWENWFYGRRKAVWISVGSDLKYDSRRDLDDVGATNIEGEVLSLLSTNSKDVD